MKVFAQILNIFLALLLLLTTSGVTLHKHYCMGRLKNIAVFHEAKPCIEKADIDEKLKACAMHCCEDVEEELKVTELNKVVFGFDLTPSLHPLAVLTFLFIDFDLLSFVGTHSSYLNYKPPLIDPDITVLIQSFLL